MSQTRTLKLLKSMYITQTYIVHMTPEQQWRLVRELTFYTGLQRLGEGVLLLHRPVLWQSSPVAFSDSVSEVPVLASVRCLSGLSFLDMI